MASERRLARTLLFNWIWTLSLLLIVCGLVTFVVFLGHPASDRWSESGKLIGATRSRRPCSTTATWRASATSGSTG